MTKKKYGHNIAKILSNTGCEMKTVANGQAFQTKSMYYLVHNGENEQVNGSNLPGTPQSPAK